MIIANGRKHGMPYALDPDENETRAIHELVAFDDKDVLEIGSGEGRLTWRFAAPARSVLALDLNQVRIESALANTPGALQAKLTFQVADITAIELPEAAFDVAVLSWSL
jgi:ubiquinone/menaquinone biosynthesis C-methylase UbiE